MCQCLCSLISTLSWNLPRKYISECSSFVSRNFYVSDLFRLRSQSTTVPLEVIMGWRGGSHSRDEADCQGTTCTEMHARLEVHGVCVIATKHSMGTFQID